MNEGMSCGGPRGVVEETIINAIRKTATAVGSTAVLLAAVAACGTVQNLSAGQKVDQAVDRLGEQKSLAFQLDLDAEPDALTSLTDGSDPDGQIPPQFASLLAGLRIDISVKSRKPLADSGEKDLVGTSIKVAGPDGLLAEYRVVGDFTYYRTDMKAFSKAMGFPMPSADELPESEKAFRSVLEGEWVKFDTRGVGEAQTSGEGAVDGADGAGEIDAKTQQKIIKAVRGVLVRDVTLSTKSGSDGTERIVAEGNFRELITGIFEKLQPLRGELPEGAELPTGDDLKDAPNKKVAVDFTLKNGDLKQVEVDLSVLADDPKAAELPLVLKFAEAGDVSAPSGAAEIPADRMPGRVSPFGGGVLGGGVL
ncbi:hypothetical protein AB0D57_00615 [Streptomyces sp. NPDC048275]|uniref:hypothetical protein n=1 Tax=Streptomyces sp. NPDC048275 TaxID=3155629 RepID=UPI0033E9F1FA